MTVLCSNYIFKLIYSRRLLNKSLKYTKIINFVPPGAPHVIQQNFRVKTFEAISSNEIKISLILIYMLSLAVFYKNILVDTGSASGGIKFLYFRILLRAKKGFQNFSSEPGFFSLWRH